MDKTASQIMTKKLATIGMSESLESAYRMMRERGIRHLPVTDPNGEVIGILSNRDLNRAMTPTVDTAREYQGAAQFDPKYQVKDFMNWPVKNVAAGTALQEVARKMLHEKVSAFLVMDVNHHARGIVTTDDMLKLLIQLLDKGPGHLKMSLDSIMSDFAASPGHWV